jgi:hypothetical protein
MPDATFNTPENQTIAREQLICCINVATYSSPTWAVIGTHVEDSSIEFDWGEETSQDILGITHSTMKKPTLTQSFDGVKLYEGDAAYEHIWTEAIKQQNPQALANEDMLIVHLYADSAAAPFAERYPSSMVKPTSIGGEGGGFIEMPFDATYGGEREVGTATKDAETGAITFTKAA